MTDLTVAGLPIRIESADKAFFARRYADYIRTDGRESVMTMRTVLLDPVPVPRGEPVQTVGNAHILQMPDGRLCRYIRGAKSGKILFALYYTPDYGDVEIQLLATRRHPVMTQTDWEYVFTGSFFQNRLNMLGDGVLHSSAIAYRGEGVCFSANPGTGKSTHAGLWKQRFGEDVVFINDDKPAIRFDGDKAMLWGTPWSGKTDLNSNRCVPLKAIVFIDRGERNSIRRLDTVESVFRITEQINRPYYDAALGIRALDFMERLMGAVPVWCLTCNISQEAVDTSFGAIFSGKGC